MKPFLKPVWLNEKSLRSSLALALALHATLLFGGGLGLISQAEYGMSAASAASAALAQPAEQRLEDVDLDELLDDGTKAPRPRQPRPPQPEAVSAPVGRPNQGGAMEIPSFYRNPPPPYPLEARRQKLQGLVQLRAYVDAKGCVQSVSLRQGCGHAVLDTAALEAVKKWKFKPARLAGLAVATDVDVPIRFKLKG